MNNTTALQGALALSKEGDKTASRPNWWWEQKLTELLEKEKQQIIEAWEGDTHAASGEQYFNDTFQ